jgi:hypothetical protein
VTFRRIDSYATEAPDKLADQLSRLEDNITDALVAVPELLRFGDWVSSGAKPIQLAYGRVARADTATAALAVSLPSLSLDTVGKVVGVKVKGTNTVTVEPVESTALIDGAASVSLGTEGLYLYVHDGTEWSRY